jgi:hypothetical protein
MSQWFTNRGQIIQTVAGTTSAIVALCLWFAIDPHKHSNVVLIVGIPVATWAVIMTALSLERAGLLVGSVAGAVAGFIAAAWFYENGGALTVAGMPIGPDLRIECAAVTGNLGAGPGFTTGGGKGFTLGGGGGFTLGSSSVVRMAEASPSGVTPGASPSGVTPSIGAPGSTPTINAPRGSSGFGPQSGVSNPYSGGVSNPVVGGNSFVTLRWPRGC